MANRNKVPTKASAPLTGARKRKYDEEQKAKDLKRIVEEREQRRPKLERANPRNVPAATHDRLRELMSKKGGAGDPDAYAWVTRLSSITRSSPAPSRSALRFRKGGHHG